MDTFLNYIWANKWVFFITFFMVFTFTYLVFVALDFLPEAPEQESTRELADEAAKDQLVAETNIINTEVTKDKELNTTNHTLAALPVSISIPKLDKTVSIANPTSRNIADLDAALLDGVVRHPDSATLTQKGNVFILGHSSYLPTVFNKNFQAFNGIQDLQWGDMIEVTTADTVYQYRVEKVYRARAQDVTVPITHAGHALTLATCNSFGSKDDRYIVEAKRIDSQTL